VHLSHAQLAVGAQGLERRRERTSKMGGMLGLRLERKKFLRCEEEKPALEGGFSLAVSQADLCQGEGAGERKFQKWQHVPGEPFKAGKRAQGKRTILAHRSQRASSRF